MRKNKGSGSTISKLLSASGGDIKDAFKISNASIENENKLKNCSKQMFSYKILAPALFKKNEFEIVSKFTTGYSYAIEFDEDKIFTTIDSKRSSKKNVYTIQAINDYLTISKEELTKIFTFCRTDHSKITREDGIIQNDNIKKLLDL